MMSVRAIGSTVFTAIYLANFQSRLRKNIPGHISKAVLSAGLPAKSLGPVIGALSSHNATALSLIPGVTPLIAEVGNAALKQAFADSLRIVYIIASAVGAASCIGCVFMGNLRKTMGYRVDAPLEELHAKGSKHHHNLPITIEEK